MAAIYTDTEASIWPNGSVRVGFPASHERLLKRVCEEIDRENP